MAQAKDTGKDSTLGRIVARPIADTAILTTIGVRPGSGGPWSYVVGVPASGSPLIAPPPHYYALTGWGSCTAVTVIGVAHRGKIPLEGLDIEFKIERISTPGSAGFGVHKKLILKGTLSDSEVLRLRRAANFCPVDQLFTKGALEMEEQIEWASGDSETLTLTDADATPLENDPPGVVAGEVRCTHLVDTKVYTDDGALFEGEVKSYLSCDDPSGQGHWVAVAGHSFAKWVPAPVPLTLAGLAASTAATLHRALVEQGIESLAMSVEVGTIGASDRGRAQANADAGHVRERKAIRRVKVPGDPASVSLGVVRAALVDDPLTHAVRNGCVVLSEDVEVI